MLSLLGLFWDTVDMLLSLTTEKPFEIWQLALSWLQKLPVTVCQVISFVVKTNVCANGHEQLLSFVLCN